MLPGLKFSVFISHLGFGQAQGRVQKGNRIPPRSLIVIWVVLCHNVHITGV